VSISRRTFIGAGAAAAASLTLDRTARAEVLRAATHEGSAAAGRPVVVASANGIRGVARAYDMITRQNADTLDAIINDRPYRPAQSLQAARAEIEKWSGRQFDPDVVKVFLDMPDKIWEDLRKDIDAQIYRVAYSTGAKG